MKRKANISGALLLVALFLPVLSGCSKVDSGLLNKTTSALAALETFESGGFRQDSYIDNMEAPAHTSEVWFRADGEGMDWYMLTTAYGDDGALQMESAVVQWDGERYYRYSTPDKEGVWSVSDGAAPSDEVGFPTISCLDKGEDYEFFRKEKDGSFAFAYSQTGLAAFRAQLVALVKNGIPTEFDESQYTEEELTAVKEQNAYIVATAEKTKVTAFSGFVVLDEGGALLQHRMQYNIEPPELDFNGDDRQTAADTKMAEMKFVTKILARSDAEAEQKLTELFAQLP